MNKNNNQLLRLFCLIVLGQFFVEASIAQPVPADRQDSLRGSIGPGRLQWNVLHYDISVQPDFNSKTIQGKNNIRFWDDGIKRMQIDLQEPMQIDSALWQGKPVRTRLEGNVYWVYIRDTAAMYKIKPGPANLLIYFSGTPRAAVHPPWDGGWIWKTDSTGNPWMSVACQGTGASVWYPCKDTQADEPDSGAILRIIVPDSLVAVGNGRLIDKTKPTKNLTEYVWEVKNPINNYNIIPYIGKYVHFAEKFQGEKGILDMDYWVLAENEAKAKIQFSDAARMMRAFEHWFGPYPFYEDGYKLVESPHLGMEHQSAIAYGNQYKNGYLGNDLSGSGWGEQWDFIIVHESGHEWFGNNITTKDIADMWVHEGFTNYSETLFTEFYYGKDAGNAYLIGSRKNIANKMPIIGQYGVQDEGSGDMYAKGGNLIHFIRQVIHNDKKFRKILRGLNKTFYHQTVTTAQIETYISQQAKIDFSSLFDQYLRTTKIPVLEYQIEEKRIAYRWNNVVPGFDMPIRISLQSDTATKKCIKPSSTWKYLAIPKNYDGKTWITDPTFYVETKALNK